MGKLCGKPYRPSNGTEGEWFISTFCENCIHEKFVHTQRDGDKACEILTGTMCFDTSDKEYPKEWQYDEHDRPTCTKHKYWNWGNDDEGGLNEPPPEIPDDPNQLCLPFMLDEVEENVTTRRGKWAEVEVYLGDRRIGAGEIIMPSEVTKQ